jgi:clan AA aspartic protease (TIGR02281 family)
MGVQDRDWWRNRRGNLDPDDWRRRARRRGAMGGKPGPARPGGRARLLLFLLFLAVLGVILWNQRTGSAPGFAAGGNVAQPAGILQRLNPACADPFPPASATAANPDWRTEAIPASATQFVNRTPIDRMVDLMSGDQVLLSVAVPASQTSTVRIPAGSYGWRLRQGAAWCASTGKFVREQRTNITTGLDIVATSMLTVDIVPDGQHPSGFVLRASDRPVVSSIAPATAPKAAEQIAGGLLLPRAADGHYYLSGTIEGLPVQFMVDTGATGVAIPAELAQRLGYFSGRDLISNTANGRATGYAVRVRRLEFGPFVAENIEVAALPALDRPLLGMSVLQALEIRQTAAGLELRPGR